MTTPSVPDGLQARGQAFWKATLTDFDASTGELELLAEAARALDEIDALKQSVTEHGATVTGSRGQVRVHPAIPELRQARAELRRLLDQLGVTGIDEDTGSTTSRKAARAARKRWEGRGAA